MQCERHDTPAARHSFLDHVPRSSILLAPSLLRHASAARDAGFAPLTMEPMRVMAIGSLIGHLIDGLVLGGVFAWLVRGMPHGAAARPA
jgi:hypothetical protein